MKSAAICQHVVLGDDGAFHVEHPDDDPGLIVCRECGEISRPLKNIDTFASVCKQLRPKTADRLKRIAATTGTL